MDATAIINLEVETVDKSAIAALLLVTALWDHDPFAVRDVVVIGFLRHTLIPENQPPQSMH